MAFISFSESTNNKYEIIYRDQLIWKDQKLVFSNQIQILWFKYKYNMYICKYKYVSEPSPGQGESVCVCVWGGLINKNSPVCRRHAMFI